MNAPYRVQRPAAGIPAQDEYGWPAGGIWIILDNFGTGKPMNKIKRQNIIFPHFTEGMVGDAVETRRNKVLDAGKCGVHSAATRPACEWLA